MAILHIDAGMRNEIPAQITFEGEVRKITQ